jgi:C4-dicarboxylate-specific signal transduction histidine kinase/CheY-like chemotaxis protein
MTGRPGAPRNERIDRMRDLATAEEAVLRSELDTVYGVAPLALASITLDLQVRRINERLAKLLGKPAAELIGKSLHDLIPDRGAAAAAAVQRIIETGEALHGVNVLCPPAAVPRHGGAESWFAQKSAESKIVGIMIAIAEKPTDADEPFRAEGNENLRPREGLEQAQKMEALGRLAGGVAHDFNNLLTVIGGNLELITHRTLPADPVRRHATAAQEAVTTGKRLIEHMLAFSRRRRLRPKTISVLEVLREGQDLLRRAAGGAIRVEFVLEPTLWPCRVDPTQLETALLNLALNARDAMPRGGTLTFAAHNVALDEHRRDLAEPLPGAYVLIAATDTGEGMSRSVCERAFEPFFTTKPAGKGTGLGLSMVHGFARQTGGHAVIRSRPGAGATIELYLPKAGEAAAPALPQDDTSERVPRGSALVLVVEDDESVLQTISDLLADLGYRTVSATNGAEALTTLRRNPEIGLVLTDVVMPGGMSGIELGHEVRRLRAGIKILLTSGYAEDVLTASNAEDEFPLIGKPLRQEPLARALLALLAET